jgi:hypothetical protein
MLPKGIKKGFLYNDESIITVTKDAVQDEILIVLILIQSSSF